MACIMKRIFILILIGCCCRLTAVAQNCGEGFLGTKTLYRQSAKSAVKIPAGYKAVFINYAGRHGARHLTKSPQSEYGYRLVMQADSTKALTAAGKQLKNMILLLDKVEQGNTKSISGEGREELKGIGQRLFQNNRSVFAGVPKISVFVTKEIRTRQSADAFLAGLKPLLVNPVINQECINDTTLRFYDLSPAYKEFEEKGSWIGLLDKLKEEKDINGLNRVITARLFNGGFLNKVNDGEKEVFVNDLFGFAAIVYSLQQEITANGYTKADLNFQQFFTCNELSALSAVDVADDFLKKGPGINNNGIQVKIAAPLLIDFVKTTDAFINNHPVNACLRFAHAETIAPFAALLNLKNASTSTTNPLKIGSVWQSGKVAPLSANVQWILYRNQAGKYLLRCLLNEKDVEILGIKPLYDHFYSWASVKRFYISKLKSIGITSNTDMLTYLKQLK